MAVVALSGAPDSDLALLKAVQKGDRGAFARLVREQDRWVRGVIFSVLGDPHRADDVAQQVWLSVWRRAAELRDLTRWKPWLYRLVYRAAIDAGREVARRRARTAPLGKLEVSAKAASGAAEREDHQAVLDAVLALPAIYREPFVLRHVNGWSYQQIAEVMEMGVDSIETRLVRARRLLRDALRAKAEGER